MDNSSIKVIYIISFPPEYDYFSNPIPDHIWVNELNQQLFVWRIDWGHVFAKNVKKYFPEIEYEVWRPDYRARKEYIHQFEDGVIHRSFPAQQKHYRFGLKKSLNWTSNELLYKLQEEIQEIKISSKHILLHLPVDFSFITHTILKKYIDKIPFLHTSHLEPKLLVPSINTYNPIRYLHRLGIKKLYKKHLNLIKEIAVTSDRVEFFKNNTNANVYEYEFLNFDLDWAKNKINKTKARIKLNISINKFVLFASSRIVKEKQIDLLLYSLFKLKDLDFVCIISGTGEEEYIYKLKQLVDKYQLNNHVKFIGYITDSLLDYYCASDVFISTSISEGGPVSTLKAIALGIPVITTKTGLAASILNEKNAGLILQSDFEKWHNQIREIIKGKKIEIIDVSYWEEKYNTKNTTNKLVECYKKAASNFYK